MNKFNLLVFGICLCGGIGLGVKLGEHIFKKETEQK